ncbi:MAG TPA: hypothetical protein VOA87_22810 [Thermoanaerobaculia bacterium]|nr:hypothetical protein [Thermoanaerobaculia bacterium]
MPSFESLFLAGLLVAIGLSALALFAGLRRGRSGPAAEALGQGRFAAALAAVPAGRPTDREELYAAAVAARHLLDLDRAGELLGRILATDPGDGEALLEGGLVAAYRGDFEEAARGLAAALSKRSDLAESITLHQAWLALRRGDRAAARRLFDEVEVPLETKLRSDLGEGEPLFSEWFLHAAILWSTFGDRERAEWAAAAARQAAPESRLWERAGVTPSSATIELP